MSSDHSKSLLIGKRLRGIPFIVSAPSGAGKTTLCRAAQEKLGDLRFCISHTTRAIRPGEVHGRDYYFTDEQDFRAMIENGAFAEWAEVHGNLYGTSIDEISRARTKGEDLLVEIDVQGAAQLRKSIDDAVYIFVLPPDLDTLESRLRGRGTDDEDTIQRRLTIALREIQYQKDYDYVFENNDFDRALDTFCGIVGAERVRSNRFE